MQRSQHITQADPRVFGSSYVANCSSVEGLAAFLGEETEHRHIEYFQGLERARMEKPQANRQVTQYQTKNYLPFNRHGHTFKVPSHRHLLSENCLI